MQRPARDLQEIVSESVWLRLGQSMARCVDKLITVLRDGAESGQLSVEDPDYTASVLWTQVLGAMHLARCRVGIKLAAPDIPELFPVAQERVVETCVSSALATAGATLTEPDPAG
jgi:hypothetical protein